MDVSQLLGFAHEEPLHLLIRLGLGGSSEDGPEKSSVTELSSRASTWILWLWLPEGLLLLLSCFCCVRFCATPQTAAHQDPPSLRFSRQEHWSVASVAISFSNARKWQWSRLVVSDSSRPHGLQRTRLLCPWDFPRKSTGVGCHCLLRPECLGLYYKFT